jgi:hypothetical protein
VKIPENTHNLLKTNFTIENSIETHRVGCVVCVCVCVCLYLLLHHQILEYTRQSITWDIQAHQE